MTDKDRLDMVLAATGKWANSCRSLVGGYDLGGRYITPPRIDHVERLMEQVRRYLDEYDETIRNMHRSTQ